MSTESATETLIAAAASWNSEEFVNAVKTLIEDVRSEEKAKSDDVKVKLGVKLLEQGDEITRLKSALVGQNKEILDGINTINKGVHNTLQMMEAMELVFDALDEISAVVNCNAWIKVNRARDLLRELKEGKE